MTTEDQITMAYCGIFGALIIIGFVVGGLERRSRRTRKVTTVEKRPSFHKIYMDLAVSLAQRSTCSRLQVGTVITTTDFRKVIAVGYNGNARNRPNCCDRDEPGNCGCLHSEENAIINCDAPRETSKIVFITHLPCAMCAKRLVNLRAVSEVLYRNDYRSKDGLGILFDAGINTLQFGE